MTVYETSRVRTDKDCHRRVRTLMLSDDSVVYQRQMKTDNMPFKYLITRLINIILLRAKDIRVSMTIILRGLSSRTDDEQGTSAHKRPIGSGPTQTYTNRGILHIKIFPFILRGDPCPEVY